MQVAAVQSSNARTELTVTELMDADPKENRSASFAMEQRQDTELKEVINYLSNKELPPEEEQARQLVLRSLAFSVVDDILYLVDPRKRGIGRAVVPKHLQGQLLE